MVKTIRGVPYIKEYGIAVQAMNWMQVSDKKKAKINADMVKLARNISRQKSCVGMKTKFMFNIMRMMQIKNMGSGEKEKEYWKENGWLDSARPWN